MTTLLHISDPHFGTERPEVLAALLDWVQQHPPDLVIISGDFTQRARPAQFRAAAAFLRQLPECPKVMLPGNHDIPLFNLMLRFTWPFRNYSHYISPDLSPEYINDDVAVLCVNSARGFYHKDGAISERQVQETAQRLEALPGHLRKIVVTHHPFDVELAKDEENVIRNGEKALRRWARAGLDLVLGGHIHFPFMAPLRRRYPDLDRDTWILQAGTATSRRVRNGKPNSFNRIHCAGTDAGLDVERWDFSREDAGFVLAHEHRLWPEAGVVKKVRK